MKNHPLRTSALIAALFAFSALTACSRQTAEEKGKELATEKIDIAKGIGDAMQAKGEAAGDAVATGMGKVINGIEKGVNKSGRAIVTDASVDTAGLKITKLQDAKRDEEGKGKALDVYILSSADVNGKLRVTVFDVMDKEIARTSVDLKKPADEGKYHKIALDEQLELNAISKVAFEFKPLLPAARKAP
jgi:hypothetical protein